MSCDSKCFVALPRGAVDLSRVCDYGISWSTHFFLTILFNIIKAALSGSTLLAYGKMIRYDPTLVDLTRNFFVICTNVKVYLYSFS